MLLEKVQKASRRERRGLVGSREADSRQSTQIETISIGERKVSVGAKMAGRISCRNMETFFQREGCIYARLIRMGKTVAEIGRAWLRNTHLSLPHLASTSSPSHPFVILLPHHRHHGVPCRVRTPPTHNSPLTNPLQLPTNPLLYLRHGRSPHRLRRRLHARHQHHLTRKQPSFSPLEHKSPTPRPARSLCRQDLPQLGQTPYLRRTVHETPERITTGGVSESSSAAGCGDVAEEVECGSYEDTP